jgi:hypothetical protein
VAVRVAVRENKMAGKVTKGGTIPSKLRQKALLKAPKEIQVTKLPTITKNSTIPKIIRNS